MLADVDVEAEVEREDTILSEVDLDVITLSEVEREVITLSDVDLDVITLVETDVDDTTLVDREVLYFSFDKSTFRDSFVPSVYTTVTEPSAATSTLLIGRPAFFVLTASLIVSRSFGEGFVLFVT